MDDQRALLLVVGETFATNWQQVLPAIWVIGLLLCIDHDWPGLSRAAWRLLRNLMAAAMAIFLMLAVAYGVYGLWAAAHFDHVGFANLASHALSRMWLSIALAATGVVLWFIRRPKSDR